MAERERFRGRPKQVWSLLRGAGQEWVADKAPKQAAALAYYALFALGPLLLIAVSVAGLLFGQTAAREAVTSQLGRLLGADAQRAIESLMAGGVRAKAGLFGLVAGGVALLLGAAGVFAQLREALNTVWEVEAKRVQGWKANIGAIVRRNLLGFAGVLGVGFLLLVSLAVSAAIAAGAKYASSLMPGAELLWTVLHFVVSVAIVSLLFALIYRYLPDTKVAWRDVSVGAAVTGLLFVVGELGIGFYLGQAATATRYGAAGAVLVLLLWVYYSGLVLLYGAELTQVYANRHGAQVRPAKTGEPLPQAVLERQAPPEKEGVEPPRPAQTRKAARKGTT
ncbi:MAG: rane protein [Thermoplasmata archaeon]|jgi:membrane protein|nr:rane protein [Thermoplasmata archaeon]